MFKNIYNILIILIYLILCPPFSYGIIGPIPINISNELPDGPIYATVTVSLLTDFCSNNYNGVKIVADANESLLIPGPNFGIQDFGFNYSGENISDLIISKPENWKIKINKNMSEFGVFLYEESGTGNTRMDPLVINICSCSNNLNEGNFVTKNSNGYVFALHIADFYYNGTPSISSAFFSTIQTTLVELTHFNALPGNSYIILQWTTESEVDTVGFNIYRSETVNGDYTKINEYLITSEGSSLYGSFYEFFDDNVKNRKTYFYKLEDIDIYGKSTFHGPVQATPSKMNFSK